MLLKQRMFRIKPYTKCLDCIRTDHIKCKNCMEKLVNQIIQKKDHAKPKLLLYRSPKYKHLYDQKFPVKIDFIPASLSTSKSNFRNHKRQAASATKQQKQIMNSTSPLFRNSPLTEKSSNLIQLKQRDLNSSIKNQLKDFRQSKSYQYEIHSKYDLWMKHISLKNDQQHSINYSKTLGKWPVKKRMYLSTEEINKNYRKFQKWQQKFIERVKQAEENKEKQLEKSHFANKIPKTAINQLRQNLFSQEKMHKR